jgi:heat shock protein HtpX
MTTFYTHRQRNTNKTWVLMLSFIGIVVGLGWFLSYYFNDQIILYLALGISLVMNIWAYWFSHITVVKMTGAKEVSFGEQPELHRLVENLSITAGLPKPKVYVVEDRAPNAFATGRNKEHALVAVTTGLLEVLDREELEGVIAHVNALS